MKGILESINEARDTEIFYVIKFVSGKYKDKYLSSDGEFYTASNYSVEYGVEDHSRLITNRNPRNAQSALDHFNDWSKGNWGEAVIVEITATQKVIR